MSKLFNSRSLGFTLLEILISLSLTAVLLTLLALGIHLIVNDWEKVNRKVDQELDKSLTLLQIERAIQGAYPHVYQNEKNKRLIYFYGKKNEMRMVSTVSPNRTQGLTAWRIVSTADGIQLYLTPAFADNPDVRFDQVKPLTVFPEHNARFSYLSLNQKNKKYEWLKSWNADETSNLPVAVKMTMIATTDHEGEQTQMVSAILANQHETLKPSAQ